MKRRTVGFMCSAVFALMAVSSHAVAQQKTVRACQEEWRANKAANQANGITEKAYVAQCRGGGVTTAPTPVAPAPSTATPGPTPTPAGQKTVRACREEWRANKAANQANGVTERAYVEQCRAGGTVAEPTAAPPAPAPAPSAAAPRTSPSRAVAGQKTVRACREEWRANKAANQANGVTERAYVEQCRAGGTVAEPTAAPAAPAAPPTTPTPTAAPAAPAPTPTAAAPPTSPVPAPTIAAGSGGANQFSTEAQAKARCPSDTVVWVNLNSKIYHFSGTKSYGTTKNGAYMCEKDTVQEGMRAAKNEKHP